MDDRLLAATGEKALLGSFGSAGGDSGSSTSIALILDSTDWEDTPRDLGGTVRRNGGGELGGGESGEVSATCQKPSYAKTLEYLL